MPRPPSTTLSTGVPWDNVFFKPFPLRAAFDIGTGGQITLSVARVDARHRAIKDFLFQTQAPIHVEYLPHTMRLTDRSYGDIINKTRMMVAAIGREGPGVSEAAGILTWPFTECENSQELVRELRETFKVDFRIIGEHNKAGLSKLERYQEERRMKKRQEQPVLNGDDFNEKDGIEKNRIAENARFLKGVSEVANELDIYTTNDELNQLAFLSYAAAAKVVDRSRMLAIMESPSDVCLTEGAAMPFMGGAIDIIGTVEVKGKNQGKHEELLFFHNNKNNSYNDSCTMIDEKKNNNNIEEYLPLCRYKLPIDTLGAHMMLVRDVQRRNAKLLHSFSSPNPVFKNQARELRNGLTRLLDGSIPTWIKAKLDNDFMIVGASENGGLLNIASRLVGLTSIGLEPLIQATDYVACGQTDALLGHSYPNPHLIIPQGVLCSALMGSLLTSRIIYLPQVSLAQAILIHPAYWAYSKRRVLQDKLNDERWYSEPTRRVFEEPQQARGGKFNPNLPPGYCNPELDEERTINLR